ncbi:hypothetical protein TL16_g08537 [Triparma laevis f. inornata]|uniref:Uncharacterized protein n=1 Tax=Triparma laevis f. inornata TaxID=1714386 RepID=A0A9W7B1J7_9STRA|nr:hypothetical protein TL16_g08537 [Triparma laevis f. inornata]
MSELLSNPSTSTPSSLLSSSSKIPSIKRSQDIFLRIRTTSPIDGILASSVLNAIADSEGGEREENVQESRYFNYVSPILSDRRFEQVVECVLCMIESFVDDTITGNSTVSILNSEFDLMCASKSAYALTRLGAHNSEKLCTIQPRKIMKGLSKYSKALLSSNSTDLKPSEVSYCCYVFGYVYRFSGIRCEGTLSECCRRMVEGEMYKNMLVEDLVRVLSGLGEMKIEGEVVEKGIEGVKRRLVKLLKFGVPDESEEDSQTQTKDVSEMTTLKMTNLPEIQSPPKNSTSNTEEVDSDTARIAVAAANEEREKMSDGDTVVVDAATILAAAKAEAEEAVQTEAVIDKMERAEGGDEKKAEEVITKIEQVESEEGTEGAGVTEVAPEVDPSVEDPSADPSPVPVSFTPQDLSIIMWSLTTQSKQTSQILNLAVKHLHLAGTSAFEKMEGMDLANVAWAIAKGSGKNLYSKKTRKMLAREDVRGVLGQIAKWR